MSSERSAMVLVAHADDESLGAGGAIQHLVRGGWRVEVVILSDGRITARSQTQDNRPAAAAACARLGIGAPRFLGFPDQRFDREAMADLANAVFGAGLSPDLILTHAASDLNMDHRLTLEAAKIFGRPRGRPISILSCEIPSISFWNGAPFRADYFVPMSEEMLETKIEAFAAYSNELMPFPHPCSREGIRTLARYHGMQAGVPFAEAFELVRGYAGLLP